MTRGRSQKPVYLNKRQPRFDIWCMYKALATYYVAQILQPRTVNFRLQKDTQIFHMNCLLLMIQSEQSCSG